MTLQNSKKQIKPKSRVSNKSMVRNVKKKKNGKIIDEKKKINSKLLVIITFFTGVLLIISTYAWFSASLNVKIKFFDMSVSTDNGLFISLDGINFSDTVEISIDSVINKLRSTYPNHTNQWAAGGLWPVSSDGVRNFGSNKFGVYQGEVSRFKNKQNNRRYLNTKLINEDEPSSANAYIAFDLFLKNVSGSPKSDNLYLDDGTSVGFADDTPKDTIDSMSGIMNSMRFGFIKVGSVSLTSDARTIQNLKCNGNCETVIYEPNSSSHSNESIDNIKDYGVSLVDGRYNPTYAVINEGDFLDHVNGQEGSGVPLDTAHFALQKTITNFDKPIFQIPDGITKLRAYVWLEGQDMDSLETISKGAAIDIAINFVKDLAGYN